MHINLFMRLLYLKVAPRRMMMTLIKTALLCFLALPANGFLTAQSRQRVTALCAVDSTLYNDEPTEARRDYIRKEEGNPKHSMFHVERGPERIDNKADPAHSLQHHLIDVNHDELNDLGMRAQKAWLPVNVHEMDVDPGECFPVRYVEMVPHNHTTHPALCSR